MADLVWHAWPDLVWLAGPPDLSQPSGMFLPVLPLAKC